MVHDQVHFIHMYMCTHTVGCWLSNHQLSKSLVIWHVILPECYIAFISIYFTAIIFCQQSTQLVAELIMLPTTFIWLNFSFLCFCAYNVYCVHFMYAFVVVCFTMPFTGFSDMCCSFQVDVTSFLWSSDYFHLTCQMKRERKCLFLWNKKWSHTD